MMVTVCMRGEGVLNGLVSACEPSQWGEIILRNLEERVSWFLCLFYTHTRLHSRHATKVD